MSIDKLQESIRKRKNPSVLELNLMPDEIPAAFGFNFFVGCVAYGKALLDALKEIIPAVRLSYNAYSIYGAEGLTTLETLLNYARDCGYYVILDCPEVATPRGTEQVAQTLFAENFPWYFDAAVITAYIGSDGIRPFVDRLQENEKSVFVVVRTANKTAAELQDLLSGSRLSHVAKADIINRFAQPLLGRCAYSQVALLAGASSADSLRVLRTTYKYLFILIDGSDYANANAKNCSYAFDSLGHGAAACAGSSITAAWQSEENADPISAAVSAAERMRKNLTRYVTIL